MKTKFQISNFKFQIPARRQAGFTLIELLVVVAILGILAVASFAILDPAYQLKKARDSRRKTDLGQLQAAFELYRADQGSYPTSLPACGSALSANGTTYIRSIPCDPKNTSPHVYTYTAAVGVSPLTYSLTACLENTNDPQRDATNVLPCDGTSNASYTVKNP